MVPLEGSAVQVPASYGDPIAEHGALTGGVGLVDLSWKDRLELTGADRARFLHGLVSCDVKGLVPGQGAYGFVTSHQGRILADVVVLAFEDRIWLELPPGREAEIAAHLGKYVLADRVEVLSLDDMLPLTLVGPGAAALVAELVGPGEALPEAVWGHSRVMARGTEVELLRRGRLGVEAWTLWVSASIAGPLVEDLLALGEGKAPRPAGFAALEALRVERGMPRFGIDFGPDNFPQETGADEAVSYTKGCYLGQEVVARIHYRGGVQKALRGLVFEGAVARGAKLLAAEGREVGAVGTVVESPALGRTAGLAILHRKGFEPGTVLEIEGGGRAEVRELPLVREAAPHWS